MSGRNGRFVGLGVNGAHLTIVPRRNPAFRRFLAWLSDVAGDSGWGECSIPELAERLYPSEWLGRPSDDEHGSRQKWGKTVIRWEAVGLIYVRGSGNGSSFLLGLTPAGHEVARTMLAGRRVPPAADHAFLFDPSPPPKLEPPPPAPAEPNDREAAAEWLGRQIDRESLVVARMKALAELIGECDRKHVDELDAEALFELAVLKARGL